MYPVTNQYTITVQMVCWYGELLLRQNITTQGEAAVGNVLSKAVIRHSNMPTGQ